MVHELHSWKYGSRNYSRSFLLLAKVMNYLETLACNGEDNLIAHELNDHR